MKVRFVVGIASALTFAAITGTLAQHAPRGCGSVPNASGYLQGFEKYFRDEDMAEVRGNDIEQLAPGDSQEVVTNRRKCQAVLQAALRLLRQYEPSWPEIERRGYDFTVLRYGRYYAILVKYDVDPDTGRRPAFVPLLVFRNHGVSYVTTILV